MLYKVGTVLVLCALLGATVQGAVTGRIVGGEVAQPGQFPYQISLRNLGYPFCGGSIISEKYILTAAHCVAEDNLQPKPAEIFSIRAGSNNNLKGGVVIEVQTIIINDNYTLDTYDGDVALLELVTPLTFSSTIQPIELVTEKVPDGSKIIISGWGLHQMYSKIPEKYLKYNTVEAISKLEVVNEIGLLSDQILCLAHKPLNGACNGDSGGPATYNGKLAGVAGFVVPTCGTENPDGYAKVSVHVDWIKSIIDA